MLSTVTRNSAASVVGALMWALLMQLLGVLPGTESIRPYLLGTQFEAWHGFLRVPADWTPVIRALWVCALYIAAPLLAAVRRLPPPGRRRRLGRGPRWRARPPQASAAIAAKVPSCHPHGTKKKCRRRERCSWHQSASVHPPEPPPIVLGC
jgi:hypothetical protein